MTRLAGVELQDNWNVGMETKRVKDISPEELSKIASELEKYSIEGDLLRQVKANIQRLKTTGSYRGIRHSRNLPSRGQRTRSNARTKRGKRKTVGAFKKESLAKVEKPANE